MNTLTSNILSFREGSLPVVKLTGVKNFDISKIFDCGQCFRFDKLEKSKHEYEFGGCAKGKYISVGQDGDTVYFYNITEDELYSVWQHYFSLDRDYDEINRDILSRSNEAALLDAVKLASGIRILRQDGWEAICSFIISQNNNIPRIKKLIASISLSCGAPCDTSGMENHMPDCHKQNIGNTYTFPSAESLIELGIGGLAELKTGFRAKYIYDAAQKMKSGEIDIEFLSQSTSTAECINHLCSVKGIGNKVASCALLFGFDKLDAFPIDVWIKKVMAKYFDDDFTPASLGKYAGIAQQYLFYYERYLVQGQ